MPDQKGNWNVSDTPNAPEPAPQQEDELVITLVRKTRKVKAVIDDDGTVRRFILKEMTGANRDRYLTQQIKKTKFSDAGKPTGLTDVDGIQAGLICKCLYNEEGTMPVPEVEIAQWPASTQDALFKACQTMNAMNKEGEEKEKNS